MAQSEEINAYTTAENKFRIKGIENGEELLPDYALPNIVYIQVLQEIVNPHSRYQKHLVQEGMFPPWVNMKR